MLRRAITATSLVSVLLLGVGSAAAQPPTVELTSISRQVAQIGSKFELRLNGSRLDEVDTLIVPTTAGLNATARFNPLRPLEDHPKLANVFDVAISADAQPGLIDLRGRGRFGLSNPRRMLLTHKPVVIAPGNHHDAATAMPLPFDSIVNDRCEPQKLSYFSCNLAAGDRIRLAAYSESLDSRAELGLRFMSSDGTELARNRSMGPWPAELEYECPEGGEFLLAVHDFIYSGGNDFPFALEAVVTNESQTAVQLELDQLLRPGADLRSRAQAEQGVAAEIPTERLIAPFSLIGQLGNQSVAQPVQFIFSAHANEQLSVRVQSSDWNQLTDPNLLIYGWSDDEAKLQQQLAANDDGPAIGSGVRLLQLDPSIVWTVPKDGRYCVSILDNQSGPRPDDATLFRLSVEKLQPAFELLAYRAFPSNNAGNSRPMGSGLVLGGTEEIRILAIRRDGFSGPIEITCEGLPEFVTCRSMLIPGGVNETSLILVCSPEGQSWTGSLKITGRGVQGEATIESLASPVTVAWPATPAHNAIVHRPASTLMATVGALDTAPLLVRLGDDQVLEVAQGAKLSIPIQVTRGDGGKAECLLRPRDLPPKTTMPEVKVPADQSAATVELAVAADAPIGEATLWMQNETKVRLRPNPQALEREEAYVAKLNAALASASDEEQKTKLNEAITAATAQVEELKKQTAEQEFAVWLPSTALRIRITAAP